MRNSPLRYVDLYWNSIGDEGAQAIGSALGTSQVKHLNLYDNSIGDKGAQAIAGALGTSQVEHLNLAWNSIGQAAKEQLKAAAKRAPRDVRLVLSDTAQKKPRVESRAPFLAFPSFVLRRYPR